jgi:hypothetical protein
VSRISFFLPLSTDLDLSFLQEPNRGRFLMADSQLVLVMVKAPCLMWHNLALSCSYYSILGFSVSFPVSNPKGGHKEAQEYCENLTVYQFAMRALSFLPLTSIGYLFIEQEDQKILWLASVLSCSWGSW